MHELFETSGLNFTLLWLYRVFDVLRFVCSHISYISLLFVNLTVFIFQCVRQIHGCKEGHIVCCLQIWDNPRGFLVKISLAFIVDLNEITYELVHKTSFKSLSMNMYLTKQISKSK